VNVERLSPRSARRESEDLAAARAG
jgi:hypothetical protein